MYGVHSSWIALLIFFGLFAMRAMSSQRRGRGRQGGAPPPPPGSSFTDQTHALDDADSAQGSSGQSTFTGVPAGWFTDPSGRHEQRYWSGTAWTDHVTDRGVPGTDPPPQTGGGTTSS